MSNKLFAYGTLMAPEIIKRVAGISAAGESARLPGYRRRAVKDQAFPAIVASPGDAVDGLLYRNLNVRALRAIEDYEGSWYRRISVPVECHGRREWAFTYVFRPRQLRRLAATDWDYEDFRRQQLSRYLRELGR